MYLVTIQREDYDNHPFCGENYDYGYRQVGVFDFFSRALDYVYIEKPKYKDRFYDDCSEIVMPNKDDIVFCLILSDGSSFVEFTIRKAKDGDIITVGDDCYTV